MTHVYWLLLWFIIIITIGLFCIKKTHFGFLFLSLWIGFLVYIQKKNQKYSSSPLESSLWFISFYFFIFYSLPLPPFYNTLKITSPPPLPPPPSNLAKSISSALKNHLQHDRLKSGWIERHREPQHERRGIGLDTDGYRTAWIAAAGIFTDQYSSSSFTGYHSCWSGCTTSCIDHHQRHYQQGWSLKLKQIYIKRIKLLQTRKTVHIYLSFSLSLL